MRNNRYVQCINTGEIMTLTEMARKYKTDKSNIVKCCTGRIKTTKRLRFQYASTGLYCADCMDVMRQLDDNSIDSIVTDPPYEIGFMSKTWDGTGIAYNVEMWREALRVLKPGGYLLAFGGTRTYHRMVCAIEDAGFETRDTISWIYAQGMVRGTNISKAIDKHFGYENKGEIIDVQVKQDIRAANLMSQAVHKKTKKMVHVKRAPFHKLARKFSGFRANLKPAQELICVARKPLNGKR